MNPVLNLVVDRRTNKANHLALSGIMPYEMNTLLELDNVEWIPSKNYLKLPLKLVWMIIYNYKNLEMSPGCRAWYRAVEKKFFDKVYDIEVPDNYPGLNPDYKLRDYQRRAIQFAVDNPKAIWGVDTRLGKTFMTYALSEYVKAKKVLIVCPANVKWNWHDEIHKFTDYEPNIVLLDGNKQEKIKNFTDGYMIVNFETLSSLSKFNKYYGRSVCLGGPVHDIKWDLICIDECHMIKNAYSMRGAAVRKLEAPRKIPMSGTPMPNGIHEWWSVLNWLNPLFYPKYKDFESAYCNYEVRHYGARKVRVVAGYKDNVAELHRIIKKYMMRIKFSEVVQGIDERVIEIERYVDMNPTQLKLYNDMKKNRGYYKEVDGHKVLIDNPMAIRARVSRILSSPYLLDESYPDDSRKIDEVVDLITNDIDGPSVIMSQYPRMIELINKRLKKKKIDFITTNSTMSLSERQDCNKRFDNGEGQVFTTTIGISQVGIRLARANTIIFTDATYVPVEMLQAARRIFDPDKKDIMTIYHLITKNTIDEHRHDILKSKQAIISMMVDGEPPSNDLSGLFTEMVKQEFGIK